MRVTVAALAFTWACAGCATVDESALADVKPARSSLDASKMFTLEEIGRLAVERNFDLAAARASLPVKDAEALRAGLWPDPSVSVSVTQPVVLLGSTDTTGFSLGADWDIGSVAT